MNNIYIALFSICFVFSMQFSQAKEGAKSDFSDKAYNSKSYPGNFEQDDKVIKKLYAKEYNGFLSNYIQEDEVVEKRNASSKTFKNTDGSYTAVLGSGPVHYLENNLWKTISNEIVQDGNSYYNKWNEFKTRYTKDAISIILKNKSKIKLWQHPEYLFLDANANEIDNHDLSFNNPVVKDDELSYHSSELSITAKIKQLAVGTELSYIISDPSVFGNNRASYFGFKERVTIQNDAKLLLKQDEKRGTLVVLADKNGNEIMEYENPIISESLSSNFKDSSSHAINGKFKINQLSNNEYEIIYYAELAWFQNPNRQFPIIFDPVINCVPSNVTYGTGYFRHHVVAANDGVDNDWRVGL